MARQDDSRNIGASARRRLALYGLVSVLVAAGAAWASWTIVREYEKELEVATAERASERVVVALRDLPAGHLIGPEDVGMRSLVGLPDEVAVFGSVDDVIGQSVGERVLAGDPVRAERLTVGGSKPRLDEVIDVGARAVTVRVASDAGVGGLLVPGTFVDVMVVIRPDDDQLSAEWVAETILQGVRVLAVDDFMASSRGGVVESPPEGGPGDRRERTLMVTLEVEPAEAEGLALAVSRGAVRLSLRAHGDLEMLESRGPLVTNALLGVPPPVKVAQERRIVRKRQAEARKERIIMEVIRGRERTTQEVGPGGDGSATGQP